MRDQRRPETAGSPPTADAGYWEGRAEEAHAIAVLMLDPGAKATMLDLAAMYLAMARHAAVRRARSVRRFGIKLRPVGAD